MEGRWRTRRAERQETSATMLLVNRVLMGFAVFLCLGLFALWRTDNPRVERLRLMVADWVEPVFDVTSEPLQMVGSVTRDTRTMLDVYDQNRALRQEIQALKGWREAARRLEEENAQLRALNNVRLAARTTFVTGELVADSGGPYSHSALVNVGRSDGVLDGAPAVDGAGVVGRVAGVGERAARLILLTDYSSRVPVLIQPSGRRAILAGDGTSTPLLRFLDAAEDIRAGLIVETSGDGGMFPPHLPVGRVVVSAEGELRVLPAADYRRLDFVRLLRYRPVAAVEEQGGLVLSPDPATETPADESEPGATAEARP